MFTTVGYRNNSAVINHSTVSPPTGVYGSGDSEETILDAQFNKGIPVFAYDKTRVIMEASGGSAYKTIGSTPSHNSGVINKWNERQNDLNYVPGKRA